MILGIFGLRICQICGPFAWSIGKKAVTEIDASGGAYTGRGRPQVGYVMGMILLGLGVLAGLIGPATTSP